MIVAIHQPHYLPWLRYFHKIASCDVFVLLDDAQFTKNGWQNRNTIKGAQGPVLLTVPVRNASFKPINWVEIHQQTAWREKHWKSLLSCYARAPFFGRYAEIFEHMYATTRWVMLSDLTYELTRELCSALRISTPLVLSSSLSAPGRSSLRLVELCRRLGATKYLTGAFAAANHLDWQVFADAGIKVVTQEWVCPTYSQQFESIGFLPELSAVDLLFNEGPASLGLLMNGSTTHQPELVSEAI